MRILNGEVKWCYKMGIFNGDYKRGFKWVINWGFERDLNWGFTCVF